MCSPTDQGEDEDGNMSRPEKEGPRGSDDNYPVNVKGFTYNFM